MNEKPKCLYEFGPFHIDVARRLLLRGGETVPLAPKVFDTLLALVENSEHELSKDDLMKRVWPDSFVEEGNLTFNIFTLRKALGERPNEHQYIVTIPGRGYRFVAAVMKVVDESAGGLAQAPATIGVREETHVGSCAVLPFKSLGASGDDQYLGMGMTDALITKLSNIHQIVVRPTSAVRKYAETEQDPVAAGRELRVQSVLEGSIRRAGDRIRVTAQLVSVRDGVPLWADKFDVSFTDIFAVEDLVSEQMTKALTLKLTGNEKKLLTKRYTDNSEAYGAYLRGRYHSNKWTLGFKSEIKYFNQAIQIDPTYALAYAGLADAYYRASTVLLPPNEAMPKAREASLKAVEMDDSLAEAHASLGVAREYCDWDLAEAEKEFRRAIELNPNYALGRLWFGLYLTEMGRLDESIAELQQAQQLDPLSLEINAFIALPFYCARQYDRAIEQLEKTLEIDPIYPQADYFLGWAYEQKCELAQAIAQYQKSVDLIPHFPMGLAALGHAFAVWGKKDEARKMLEQLNERSSQVYVSPYDVALVHIGLGETDRAFELLEKAFEERSVWMVRLNVDLRLDSLRSDPRFVDLVRRVGLAP